MVEFLSLIVPSSKESGEVGKMAELMKQLTERTRAATGGIGEVIWYDAVTSDGELKWQDELNEKNADFFFNCDGIFLNYNWKAENLKKSLDTLRSRNAIGRSTDIYVGIDVFGRGCFGGFDCNKSLELITGASTSTSSSSSSSSSSPPDTALSVAVFAAAWTHEKIQEDIQGAPLGQEYYFVGKLARLIVGKTMFERAARLLVWYFPNLHKFNFLKSGQNVNFGRASHPAEADKIEEAFLSRECRFWSLLEPFMFLRGPAAVPDAAAERVLFSTDFSSGCSEKEGGRDGWTLDLAAQRPQCSFMGERSPRTPPRRGSGLMLLKQREEGPEKAEDSSSTATPLLVCRFVRGRGLALVIEVEVEEAEAAAGEGAPRARVDYKMAVLGDGDKLREIERSATMGKADVFTVPDDLDVVQALGVILGRPSLIINSVRVLHLPKGDCC